jgi:hypothetical protein
LVVVLLLVPAVAAAVFVAPAVVLGPFHVVVGSSLVLVLLAVSVAAFLLCLEVLPASTFLPLVVPLGVVGRLLLTDLEAVVEEAPVLVSTFSALRVDVDVVAAAEAAAAAVRCLIRADDDD